MADSELGRFEEFITHRLPALYRYACVLTGNHHDAEDLVQEALTRVGTHWWRVRHKDDPEGYVRTAMVRILANRRRGLRERLMAHTPDQPVDDAGLDGLISDAAMIAYLAGLPRRMRAVLVLRYVDQLGDAEIAEVLGCSPATVRSQAARGLAKLRTASHMEESHE
ncbi:SigE family RNA polymerase sigma factor [Actinomadura fulvescens]|uniref:SigE family RNA polymerase sigma factor n=2 Tax=Actinomadura fulvescens TaxID=46160 RepID=A0ABP6D9B6_9ACTN